MKPGDEERWQIYEMLNHDINDDYVDGVISLSLTEGWGVVQFNGHW